MKRLVLIPICFLALAVPVVVLAGGGAQGGFDGVVSSIESRYHVHAQRIPFLGLISFISHKATSGGVSGMHVAEIDDFHADVDGEELNKMVEEKLGAEWERVIRETSHSGNSQTLIYMHPEGPQMGLFVLDLDGHEMDVVQVSVDPNHLNESIGKYEHHQVDSSKEARRDDESD
ncbi:MAG: hypothetical protein WB561_20705 [Terracidiphilus sp.]